MLYIQYFYVGWLILSLQGTSWPQTSPSPHFFASNSYVSKDGKPQTRLCRRVLVFTQSATSHGAQDKIRKSLGFL